MKCSVTNLLLPCALCMAAAAYDLHLRHDKHMIVQPPTLLPPVDTSTKNKHDQKVMDAISQMRAEMCASMHDEHGKDFASYESCSQYMETACHPGGDKTMDGDSHEITSEKGFCKEYFPAIKK